MTSSRESYTPVYDLAQCLKIGIGTVKVDHYKTRVINKIIHCRTIKSGRHHYVCGDCKHEVSLYNSCGNRHCNRCQTFLRDKWVLNKKKDLLPVDYFHMVFAMPNLLRSLIYSNQKLLYSLMFKAASETLIELAKDQKFLGAKIGVIATLHTWGQQLNYHPHIHCIIPNGGLSNDLKSWIHGRKKFFLPIQVMSELFKGKFLAHLNEYYQSEKLEFHGACKSLEQIGEFNKFTFKLRTKKWIVYAKTCKSNPRYALHYLGNYTHRVAISNTRILGIKNEAITIKYKDYRDDESKIKTFTKQSFLKHFIMHILPKGFQKTRSYGFLSNPIRKRCIRKIKKLLKVTPKHQTHTKYE